MITKSSIFFVICLLVVSECRHPKRRLNERNNLWSPSDQQQQQHASTYQAYGHVPNNNNVSPSNNNVGYGQNYYNNEVPPGNPRIGKFTAVQGLKKIINFYGTLDYDTGYATGIAMQKALGLTKIVLSPIVIPMILFVGVVLLVFFAVVGSSAVVGNALGRGRPPYKGYGHVGWAKQLSDSTAKLASNVLTSDECIERISCEVMRQAKSFGVEKLLKRFGLRYY